MKCYAAFDRYLLRTGPWDPAANGGHVETWDSMQQRLEEALRHKLRAEEAQPVPGSHHLIRDYGRPTTEAAGEQPPDLRTLTLWCWALPLSVPAHLVAKLTEENIHPHGIYAYDDDEQKESA